MRSWPPLLVLVCVVVLAACSDGAPSDPSTTRADRITAIEQARATVADPAQQLGTAAATVATRLDQAASGLDVERVEALRTAVRELDRAREPATDASVEPSTEDLRRAAEAWDSVVAQAATLSETGAAVADALEALVEVDSTLGELTASWDERGSRSQLIARFEDVAAAAEEIAAQDDLPGCGGAMQARAAAGAFVADASRELAEFARAYDGDALDARRAELAEAPYGQQEGAPRRLDEPVAAPDCPVLDEARQVAAAVEAGLDDLEAALNPSDLASE